jgi:hypothetical protein
MNVAQIIMLVSSALVSLWSQDAGSFGKLLQKAKIPLEQAARVGQQQVPDGQLFHVELEKD